ncbi:peptidoglycan-binding protein [Mangrovicoccus sp. HB161399]|uniref:peptidoglycan-binding protein n=1 Tax=Mangrovicoccus sp. HB161399 TaxID=2720392 RepID=UPI001554914B|nr:peptidoglycan-binding protein [Mangrovicoccus sp. HB161399]
MTIAISAGSLKFTTPMMRGPTVQAVQRALIRLGHLPVGADDGLFGSGTRQGVRNFQQAAGLEIDGVVSSDTAAKLDAALSEFGAPPAAATAAAAARLVPDSWMPAVKMDRIIVHWTAGAHNPSPDDKKHYHILIDSEGRVHRGKHAISANVPPLRSQSYAAHTKNKNSRSIGVSCCAMHNARERPFHAGSFPLTRAQWDALAHVCAELCLRYGIAVSRQTVLGHGEVQDILGVPQDGKWDPMVLPWAPGRPFREVGDELRGMTRDWQARLLGADETEEEIPPEEDVLVNGAALPGMNMDGETWVSLEAFANAVGWSLPFVDSGVAEITDPPIRIAVRDAPDSSGRACSWIEVAEASQCAGMQLDTLADGTVELKRIDTALDGQSRRITVQPGQTLTQIARRWLGDGNRWRELTDEGHRAFTEETARNLLVGQVILLPGAPPATPPVAPGDASAVPPPPDDLGIERIGKAIAATAPAFVGQTGRETMSRSVQAILRSCKRHGVTEPAHVAYILATANHETNLGRIMSEKWGPTTFQRSYVGRLGNRNMEEAKRYRGRGFVQITGRSNYERYGGLFGQDFVNSPDLLLEPDVAADVIVRGMSELGFTRNGFVLADLGSDEDFDYFRARSLINGDSNRIGDDRYPGRSIGRGVADTALKYREIFLAA